VTPERDVVVVGAGYAGITAARDLCEWGLDVVIGEAGGRAAQASLPGYDGVIELGPSVFSHEYEHNLVREIERYGIAFEPHVRPEQTPLFLTGGELRDETPVPADELEGLDRAWRSVAEAARRIDPRRPLDLQPLADLDISAAEFFAPLELGPATLDFLTASLAPFFGSFDSSSVLHYLEKLACYDGKPQGLANHRSHQFSNDTEELLRAMLEQAAPDLRLASAVVAIEHDDGGVAVTSADGERITARACVFTPPKLAPVLAGIEFSPPLGAAKQALLALANESRSYRINFVVENIPPAVTCIGHPAPLSVIWTVAELGGGRYLCAGAGSAHVEAIDPTTLDAAQAAIAVFCPQARVLASVAHDWVADPLTNGAGTVRPAGAWLGSRALLRQREGRLVFAGSDLAETPFANFLDGAIASGGVAAAEVRTLLGV
jgi:monoamine oxidase